jgi:hypothetical protein
MRVRARVLVPVVACLAFPWLAMAQDGQLRLPPFKDLQSHAVESVDLTLGPFPLRFAAWFMDGDDPSVAEVKKAFRSITSVRVRSFRFDADVLPRSADIDEVRRQLTGPGWAPLVHVHDRNTNEDTDIFISHDEHSVRAMAILEVSPRQLNLVHITGSLELDQIARLRRTLAKNDGTVGQGEH